MSPASRLLPEASSPSLYLTHPTVEERLETWSLNSSSWKGALSQEEYLEREEFLTTAPLARGGGVTHWILVDRELPPNQRPILASCETLRKRALVSKNGEVTAVISHGIGSVFCSPEYRGRGYASRMMRELGKALRVWQTEEVNMACAFSVLWSDIGKLYYAGHGWQPFPSTHVAFPPVALPPVALRKGNPTAQTLAIEELKTLCELDERLIRQQLTSAHDGKTHACLVPDFETMGWHHYRENFLCKKIFGKEPQIRGAITGSPGHRMWAIWTRSYYGPIDAPDSSNTLHILRLVHEEEKSLNSAGATASHTSVDNEQLATQAKMLQAIIEIAQAEAAAWGLRHVEVWNPTPLVQALIQRTSLEHTKVEREEESIPSLMWYGQEPGKVQDLEWIGNEKFGWC